MEEKYVVGERLYIIAKQLPVDERYGLRSQVPRVAILILSSIAEGCSRHSEKYFQKVSSEVEAR